MIKDNFIEITNINSHVESNLNIKRIQINAAKIILETSDGIEYKFLTYCNLDFVNYFNPQLASNAVFLAVVEEHRKLNTGDETTRLKIVKGDGLSQAVWKDNSPVSGIPSRK